MPRRRAMAGSTARATHPDVLYYVDTEVKAVALTIDDGPDSVTTAPILDVLDRNGAHATFFIITGRVPGNEKLLQRMVDGNHELGGIRCGPFRFLRPYGGHEVWRREMTASCRRHDNARLGGHPTRRVAS